jgi:nucleoid DNA-binding protein
MDITAFIRELLFSHDCVIIPGFGGFIGNYTPARIDKTNSMFYPPMKQISFNRNLNHNDGLLISKISDSAKINYGDARIMVEEYVVSLRRKLEKGEKITFDHIGSFTTSQEGNIQFEPDRNVNYHLDSYGLDAFQFLPAEGYDIRTRIAKHIDKGAVKHSQMRKVLWRAAIIIPLLAVIVVVPLKTDIFKSKIEATSLNPLVIAEFENNKKAVDEQTLILPSEKADSEAEVEIRPAEDKTVPPPSPETEVVNQGSYYLITGSFRSRENAEVQASSLRKNGYTPEIFDAPNGFFRVSAMSCSNIGDALGKTDSISKKFPGTWIKKIR